MIKALTQAAQALTLPFMPEARESAYFIYKKEHAYPLEPVATKDGFIDPAIKTYFEKCAHEWRLMDFHFHYPKSCTIEPKLQWGITKNNRVLKASAWIYYENKLKRPGAIPYKLARRKTTAYPALVSVHTGWNNYWHFYNEIIGQLAMADATEATAGLPVLIPHGLTQKRYFNDFMDLAPELQKKTWVIQKEPEYITAREAHFFCATFADRKNYDAALAYINFDNGAADAAGKEKLFLTRSAKWGRTLKNEKELAAFLKRHGFLIVECDDLTLREQMQLFKNAAVVMGIHGAAFTNIIFRRGLPLHVIELFPADFMNPCYYWMSQQYGFNYSALMGSAPAFNEEKQPVFEIDLEKVARVIESI